MLRTNKLYHQYKNQETINFPNLLCEVDKPTLILGKSGVGKTTLLHLLGGIIKAPPDSSVIIKDQDISQLNNKQLDAFRGKKIGIVFQKSNFIHSLRSDENLKLYSYLSKTKFDQKRVEDIVSRLELMDKMKQFPQHLSIGEQQRLAIARALINGPSVILADEPTSALDDENCENVIQLLQEQAKLENAALIIVTHDQRLKNYFSNQITLQTPNL
ncbi:ATP-binding cassette domain-containing protein [Saprospiraceae bacterium]|nr:ATP-binding cassette domain-containing protein [Saprospiraceae bacterium]